MGVSASGTTPYVWGALEEAKRAGALTVAVVCRPHAPLEKLADIGIVLDTGEEVLAESSRLKAGTAQKIALNMLSTAVMAKRGLVYRDEMVAMKPDEREAPEARRQDRRGTSRERRRETPKIFLEGCNWHLPSALIAAKWKLDADGGRSSPF